MDGEVGTYFWIILVCCFGVVCGLAIWGAKVIATVGTKLTAMTPSRAYSMNLGTATAVLVASFAKMPVSSTHCMVGSVIAVGLCNGEGTKAIKWKMVRNIAISWVVTVPAAGQSNSIYWFSPRICSRTLMGCSEPHQCSLGTAPCYLLFMLTCATLMTSSHSEGLVSAAIYAILRTLVRGVSLPPNAELVGCIGNCSVLPGPINVTAFNQWYSMMGYTY